MKTVLQAVVIAAMSTLALFMMHGDIGIRDCDDVGYIEGAYSLRNGDGYRDIAGEALNHWPPGYSFLLSFFPNPIQAAKVINYTAFGCCVGLLYALALGAAWRWQQALSLSVIAGFGFLRIIATDTKPDILTYMLFLSGVLIYAEAKGGMRILSYVIWSILIPFKLIAAVFTPAALIVDRKESMTRASGIILIWIFFMSIPITVNYFMTGSMIPASHNFMGLKDIVNEFGVFIFSLFRSYVCTWYGSIKELKIFIPFILWLGICVGCLLTLEPSPKKKIFVRLGGMILALIFSLAFIRKTSFVPRITGYGLLIFFFAFRPRRSWSTIWILCAAFSLIMAIFNSFCVNSCGVNDPRYKDLAGRLTVLGIPDNRLFTNSYHIMDIHARIPSRPAQGTSLLKKDDHFLFIGLPNYDGVATIVWPVKMSDNNWRKIAFTEGAALFRKE